MYDFTFPDAESFTTWFLLSQTWPALYRVVEQQVARTGLTAEKVKVLWLCTDYPPPLTPAEISRFLFRKSHSVAGLLDRMERDGLIRRVPKCKGHPYTEIQVTAKGEELIEPAKDVTITVISDLMSGLSQDELVQLQGLLKKLRERAVDRLHMDLKPWPGVGYGPAPHVDCKAL